MQKQFQDIRKSLKTANEKCRKLSQKNIKLNSMLRKLEKDKYLSPEFSDIIQVDLIPK